LAFWAVSLLIAVIFLCGGSARNDVQSLMILRVFSILNVGAALWTMRKADIEGNRFIKMMAIAMFMLVSAYLIPLPQFLSAMLPKAVSVDGTNLDFLPYSGAFYRGLAVSPLGALESWFSFFTPLAVLAWTLQLSRDEKFKLLPLLLMLGMLSGLIGLLQIIGDPQGALYFYNTTNNGSAVGLFANRNHQAVLLAMLIPALAVYAAPNGRANQGAKYRGWIAVAAGVVLVPLILVTGSRAGVILGVFGTMIAAWLYLTGEHHKDQPVKRRRNNIGLLCASLGMLVLIAFSIFSNRAEAIYRLLAPAEGDFGRFVFWKPVFDTAVHYFPIGAGPGSFVEIFAAREPDSLRDTTYLNHAHNDWLEIFLSFGLLGSVLGIIAVVAFIKLCWVLVSAAKTDNRDIRFARLGAALVMMMAMASLGDYPLRTPIFQALLVVAVLWCNGYYVSKNR
jgi:O-antigen ligase